MSKIAETEEDGQWRSMKSNGRCCVSDDDDDSGNDDDRSAKRPLNNVNTARCNKIDGSEIVHSLIFICFIVYSAI